MITRKQIALAYNCTVTTIRPRLRAAGIIHMKSITLEEFKNVVCMLGYPTNKEFTYLADLAMRKENISLTLFPGLRSMADHLKNFPGIKNT